MSLVYRVIPQHKLASREVEQMYRLMEANYNQVNSMLFEKDLAEKQLVIVLVDNESCIQGFTTLAMDPGPAGRSRPYHILFSGDTVIAPAYWGTQLLVRAWCFTAGNLMAAYSDKPWYWYLVSKGHRTYMYLPLFCRTYYPARIPEAEAEELSAIAEEVSSRLYPEYWMPEEGILRFEQSMGELKPELAKSSWDRKNHPHVNFFLTRNPGFYKGEELVCIAPLHPDNLLRTARQFVLEGMESPLTLKN